MVEISKSLHFASNRPAASGTTSPQEIILDWGLQLRLWVATCVTGLSLFAAEAQGLSFERDTHVGAAIVFFATLALYNLDGTLDAPPRSAQSASRGPGRRHHLILTAAAAGGLFMLLASLSMQAALLIALGAGACSVYAIPWSGKATPARLKSLPYLKAPFVGCAVATAAVWVPLWSQTASEAGRSPWVLTLALSFYCTQNALLFDVPDMLEDRQQKVPTIPLALGLSATRHVAWLLCLAGSLTSVFYKPISTAPSSQWALLGLGAALAAGATIVGGSTPRRSVAFWVDGSLLLPLALISLIPQ